eukprot:COSAG02_NODE_909_length_16018_cov_15.571895_18_plen_150_part_00
MAGGESHRVCRLDNSWDTTLVSGILAQYPRYCGGIVGGTAPLSHGYKLVVERQRREDSREHSIDAEEPQRPTTTATPTIMVAARCSTLRALRALRVLRVLRNAEQQCAVKWWWRERSMPCVAQGIRARNMRVRNRANSKYQAFLAMLSC